MSQNNQLKKFEFCGNSIKTSSGIKTAAALHNISSLTTCNLSNNTISDEAADCIAAHGVLQCNAGIAYFMVDNNNFYNKANAVKITRGLNVYISLFLL